MESYLEYLKNSFYMLKIPNDVSSGVLYEVTDEMLKMRPKNEIALEIIRENISKLIDMEEKIKT